MAEVGIEAAVSSMKPSANRYRARKKRGIQPGLRPSASTFLDSPKKILSVPHLLHSTAPFTASSARLIEPDTFRSNQIREGDLTREEALQLVEDENQPRYPNIKWYLDAIGFDFKSTIDVINQIPKCYSAAW